MVIQVKRIARTDEDRVGTREDKGKVNCNSPYSRSRWFVRLDP